MVCPECGLDHEGGSSQCPEGEGVASRPVEFIPLAEVTDADSFEALAHRLEEEGIPWYIQSEPPLGLGSGGPVAMIYIAEPCFRLARRALESLRPVGVEQKT
jgi:extradiol dioxygenase family protein